MIHTHGFDQGNSFFGCGEDMIGFDPAENSTGRGSNVIATEGHFACLAPSMIF